MGIEVKHYSLIDYTITITNAGAGLVATLADPVPLGGAQSYLNKVSVAQEVDNITKTTDATGSTVFSFSNDHSGTVSFELNFVSSALDELLKVVREKYVNTPSQWHHARFNIDIYRVGYDSQALVSCIDCMLKSPRAAWEITPEVGTRTYEFLAARIQERTLDEVMQAPTKKRSVLPRPHL